MNIKDKRPKLIDSFLFFNEVDLLKVRLEYLGPIVDNFIIVEANIDFSGVKKEFILSNELLSSLPFSNKILYYKKKINFKSFYWVLKKLRYWNRRSSLFWKLQDAQRNSLLEPLKVFKGNDLIIFSDLDEFPSIEAIKYFQEKKNKNTLRHDPQIYSCKQLFYCYNLNHIKTNGIFYGTLLTDLKSFRSLMPHKIKSNKNNYAHIEDGGWHFSYFMTIEKIQEKIHAISDVENLSNFKNLKPQEIKSKILNNMDLFDRHILSSPDSANQIPKDLREILKKYIPNCV